MIELLVSCSALQQPPLTPLLIRGNTTSASTQPPLTRPSLIKHEHFEHFWAKVSRVRGPHSKRERKRKLHQQVGLEVWGQGFQKRRSGKVSGQGVPETKLTTPVENCTGVLTRDLNLITFQGVCVTVGPSITNVIHRMYYIRNISPSIPNVIHPKYQALRYQM